MCVINKEVLLKTIAMDFAYARDVYEYTVSYEKTLDASMASLFDDFSGISKVWNFASDFVSVADDKLNLVLNSINDTKNYDDFNMFSYYVWEVLPSRSDDLLDDSFFITHTVNGEQVKFLIDKSVDSVINYVSYVLDAEIKGIL